MKIRTRWRVNLAVAFALASGIIPVEGFSQDVSWETAMEKVEKSAKEYRDYAVNAGTDWAGTMYNGYQYDRHRCAILGRMLGMGDLIKSIEVFEYPPIGPQSDPHDLLVFSISLDNWAGAARWALDASDDQRKNTWNLDCVGKMGIPLTAMLQSWKPQAEFEREGTQLNVYGDIDSGFFERFAEALKQNPGVTEITFGSAGGSVRDAILAGYEIRRRGLDTTIYGNCFSACPLVFMGGVHRVVWAAPYRLGFHKIYVGQGTPLPLTDDAYGLVAGYLNDVGVNSLTVIQWMFSAEPDGMYIPPFDQLCAPRVATFVQRVCNSDP